MTSVCKSTMLFVCSSNIVLFISAPEAYWFGLFWYILGKLSFPFTSCHKSRFPWSWNHLATSLTPKGPLSFLHWHTGTSSASCIPTCSASQKSVSLLLFLPMSPVVHMTPVWSSPSCGRACMFSVECRVVPTAFNVPCGWTGGKCVNRWRCERGMLPWSLKVFGQWVMCCFNFPHIGF